MRCRKLNEFKVEREWIPIIVADLVRESIRDNYSGTGHQSTLCYAFGLHFGRLLGVAHLKNTEFVESMLKAPCE